MTISYLERPCRIPRAQLRLAETKLKDALSNSTTALHWEKSWTYSKLLKPCHKLLGLWILVIANKFLEWRTLSQVLFKAKLELHCYELELGGGDQIMIIIILTLNDQFHYTYHSLLTNSQNMTLLSFCWMRKIFSLHLQLQCTPNKSHRWYNTQ